MAFNYGFLLAYTLMLYNLCPIEASDTVRPSSTRRPLKLGVQIFLFFLFVAIGLVGLGFLIYYCCKFCNTKSTKPGDVESNRPAQKTTTTAVATNQNTFGGGSSSSSSDDLAMVMLLAGGLGGSGVGGGGANPPGCIVM